MCLHVLTCSHKSVLAALFCKALIRFILNQDETLPSLQVGS